MKEQENRKMKVVCTKKEKEFLVAVLSWRIFCLFEHKYCNELNCVQCIESKVDWEITDE